MSAEHRRRGSRRTGERPGRGRSRGFAMLLVIVYGIFALSASARALVQMIERFSHAPLAYLLSLAAALTYILATVLLARKGSRSRGALWVCAAELIGVVAVGTLTIADPQLFPDATVWSQYGSGYGYVPLVLPVIALAYLWSARTKRAPADEADRTDGADG